MTTRSPAASSDTANGISAPLLGPVNGSVEGDTATVVVVSATVVVVSATVVVVTSVGRTSSGTVVVVGAVVVVVVGAVVVVSSTRFVKHQIMWDNFSGS